MNRGDKTMRNKSLPNQFKTPDKLAKKIWYLFKTSEEEKAIEYFDRGCDYFGKDKMIKAMYENS